jgi:hypothetical protein
VQAEAVAGSAGGETAVEDPHEVLGRIPTPLSLTAMLTLRLSMVMRKTMRLSVRPVLSQASWRCG